MFDYIRLCFLPFLGCFCLACMYILSLYVWQNSHSRDDPAVIKKRFISVFFTSILSPFAIYIFSVEDVLSNKSLFELMGLKTHGLFYASTIPLVLTMILFLGPLSMQSLENPQVMRIGYWRRNLGDLAFLRDHIVAPLSEELTFRACMLPLLLQCLRPQLAVLVCPLFFGLAHFHHAYGRIKSGLDIKTAVYMSSFEFMFTTLFSGYSAYLFLRTGHLVAPFLAHSFCNHVGFPNFLGIFSYSEPRRSVTLFLFVLGLFTWIWLLEPLTAPDIYGNDFYWRG